MRCEWQKVSEHSLDIQVHGTQWNVLRGAGHSLLSLEGHEDWEILLRTGEKEVSFLPPTKAGRI